MSRFPPSRQNLRSHLARVTRFPPSRQNLRSHLAQVTRFPPEIALLIPKSQARSDWRFSSTLPQPADLRCSWEIRGRENQSHKLICSIDCSRVIHKLRYL